MTEYIYKTIGFLRDASGNELEPPATLIFKLAEQPNLPDFPSEIEADLLAKEDITVDKKAGRAYTISYDESLVFPIELKMCDFDGIPEVKVCKSNCELEGLVEDLTLPENLPVVRDQIGFDEAVANPDIVSGQRFTILGSFAVQLKP